MDIEDDWFRPKEVNQVDLKEKDTICRVGLQLKEQGFQRSLEQWVG